MKRTGSIPAAPPFASTVPSPESVVGAARRLVVLVSEADWADAELPRRIWELAQTGGSSVLLLGLYDRAEEATRLRRHLVTLAASIRDNRISTEIRIEAGNDWLEKLNGVLQRGDLVVCRARGGSWPQRTPLSRMQIASLQAPVYVLPAIQGAGRARSTAFSEIVFWVGAMVIIAGFLWMQLTIDRLAQDWGQTVLLMFSVVIEFALIRIWHGLIG